MIEQIRERVNRYRRLTLMMSLPENSFMEYIEYLLSEIDRLTKDNSECYEEKSELRSANICLEESIRELKAENQTIKESFRPNCAYCKHDVKDCDTRNEKGIIIGGHGKAKPYCWEWRGLKGESK